MNLQKLLNVSRDANSSRHTRRQVSYQKTPEEQLENLRNKTMKSGNVCKRRTVWEARW